MTSAISYQNIDATFPVPGRDNDSQGFRSNFGLIKTGLETAATEISTLQANKADLVEQSTFVNQTPAVSTSTGAIVVLGGVGIGGDLYIGGVLNVADSIAITSATVFNTTTSEVYVSGTYGTPTFTIAPVIRNNHTWRGRQQISSVSAYDTTSTGTYLYVATSATGVDMVGIHSRVITNGTAIKLDTTAPVNGNKFVQFTYTSSTGIATELGSIQLHTDGQTLHYTGNVKFMSTGTFNQGLTVTTGGATVTAGGLTVTAGGASIAGGLRVTGTTAPVTTSTTGIVGQIAFDTDYIYVCIGTNSWKRAQLNTW